jgi:hypothetical protein
MRKNVPINSIKSAFSIGIVRIITLQDIVWNLSGQGEHNLPTQFTTLNSQFTKNSKRLEADTLIFSWVFEN